MSIVSRARSRKFLYQKLFALTFASVDEKVFYDSFFSWVFKTELDKVYLHDMLDIIINHEVFFMSLIQRFAPKFDITTMDLSTVLPVYIGVGEMLLWYDDIPPKVSINEAVEIAKVYGDDASKKIVNAILNKVFTQQKQLLQELKDFDTSSSKLKPLLWKRK